MGINLKLQPHTFQFLATGFPTTEISQAFAMIWPHFFNFNNHRLKSAAHSGSCGETGWRFGNDCFPG